MTRILVISYSQTGQLNRIARSMMAPLEGMAGVSIDWATVTPEPAYPFPWGFLSFLDAFPESVYLDPPKVKVDGIRAEIDYDLVVLAYQVWFLSPSLPITGFLRSPDARKLNGKPVITLVACRNMWVTAHRTMQELLSAVGAQQVDNVVYVDDAPFWSTFITTPWWLLTGNKGPLLGGILPEAGISASAIAGASRFGRAIRDGLAGMAAGSRAPLLAGLGAVKVSRSTLLGERIAHRSFRVWGKLIRAFGKPGAWARKPVLVIYVCFLVTMIIVMLPITITLTQIMARWNRRLDGEVLSLEAPSGSGTERMHEYTSG